MDQAKIRNFSIIAHVDHGKSTLADRLLEVTETVEPRAMKPQLLDQMELERERGITIKLAPVRMIYSLPTTHYSLNLIDTPGHADFSYEVSRSLAAVEGAILLVDASQGIQAQTLTTLYQALEQNLAIIPAVNKIDLANADVDGTAQALAELLGVPKNTVLKLSGKTGQGVDQLLERIVRDIPPPVGQLEQPLRALIFDSAYDPYRGVIATIRIVDGALKAKDSLRFLATGGEDSALEVGTFRPEYHPGEQLTPGEIGYVVTGLKDISQARVGDTITSLQTTHYPLQTTPEPLQGYREPKPMVFAGLFPASGEVEKLREALGKLKLNDAALTYEPASSQAFGLGFRVGFLGLLHMEIAKVRLEREYHLDLVVTMPQVAYLKRQEGGKTIYSEPWAKVEILTPENYLGPIMELPQTRRGIYQATEYLGVTAGLKRVLLRYEVPLAELITDFYDQLKSRSSGYASMSYELLDYREEDLVKLDVLAAEEPVDVLAQIVHHSSAERRARAIVARLKELIPRQWFEVKLQAVVGGKILARETIPALKKDVTGYLYGGDITRKRKLWAKQARGKKRMQSIGKVSIPANVFIELLKQ